MSGPTPSRTDPVVGVLSGVVGGPLGSRSAGHGWWGPVRVLLAVTTGVLTLGMAGRAACVPTAWSNADQPFAELCWTELAGTSAGRAGAGAPAGHLARLGERVASSLAPSAPVPLASAAVLAVLLAAVALAVTWLLGTSRPARPWAGAGWAAAPVLALHWLSWDLLAAAGVALVLAAVARRQPWLVAPGLALVVAFAHPLLTADVADTGSVWLLVEQARDAGVGAFVRTTVVVGALVAAVAAAYVVVGPDATRDGVAAARAGLVLVAAVLVVAPSAPPEAALLLLPLAAYAVPRWRDLLVWQACELLSWAVTGWYLGGALAPGGGGDSGVYWLAILLRLVGLGWLVAAALRAASAPVSGHEHAVERGGGEADTDVDLVADRGDARP